MNPIRVNRTLASRLFLIAAWFTSSGDVVFNIDLGGSVRYTQIFAVFFTFFALISTPFPRRTAGLWALVVFSIINAGFAYNNVFPLRAVFYALWLFQNILFVWAFSASISDEDDFRWAVRGCVWAATAVAAIGLLLSFLERAGFYFEIVTQPGRINGFSYEPSYFATYLIPFWILLAYVIEGRSKVWGSVGDVFLMSIISLALLLSTSRIAVIAMVIWLVRMLLVGVWDLLRGRVATRPQIGFVIAASILSVTAVAAINLLGMDIYEYVGGTGLFDTAAHSVNERSESMLLTWELFKSSPILGCSLGGVAVQIGAMMGYAVSSIAEAKSSEGASVFLEVMAGTGIAGITILLWGFYRISRDAWDYRGSTGAVVISRGLVWGMIVMFGVLQLTQNILRPYVWYYVALVCAAGVVGYKKRDQIPSRIAGRHVGPERR